MSQQYGSGRRNSFGNNTPQKNNNTSGTSTPTGTRPVASSSRPAAATGYASQHSAAAGGAGGGNNYAAESEEYQHLVKLHPEELAQQVQRERTDRLYVERLFAVREEHHGRARLLQQETHERELMTTAATFSHTLRLESDRHRNEMDSLRSTLEIKSGIGALQRDVQGGLRSLNAEQESLAQLATAAEAHESQMKNAVSSERVAWEGEKTQLLRRIGDLELAIQASRAETTGHTNASSESEVMAKRAEEAWATAKARAEVTSAENKTPPPQPLGGSHSFPLPTTAAGSGSSPPPEFRLTPIPASVVSLDAVEKARQRTTSLLDQISPAQNQQL